MFSFPLTIMTSRSLKLLGLGAAAGSALGVYLYKNPKLRKKMKKADSVKDAAGILTSQIKDDSVTVTQDMMEAASTSVSNGLANTRDAIGKGFNGKKMSAAKAGMRHLKNEGRHIGRTAKTAAKHVAETVSNEMSRVKDEAGEARDLLTAKRND